MNLQNILGQMMNASNPMQMLMGMLTPQQNQAVRMFQSQPKDKQAEILAQMCKEKNISKNDFVKMNELINSLRK